MIDEMQEEIDKLGEQIEERRMQLEEKDAQLTEQRMIIENLKRQICMGKVSAE